MGHKMSTDCFSISQSPASSDGCQHVTADANFSNPSKANYDQQSFDTNDYHYGLVSGMDILGTRFLGSRVAQR